MLNEYYCEHCKQKTRTHCDKMHGEGLVCMCIECGFVWEVEVDNYKNFKEIRKQKEKRMGGFVMSIEIYKEHEDNLLLTFGMLCFGFLMIHVIGKAVAVKVGDLSAANPLISLAYFISTFSTALVLHFNKKLGKRTKAILSIIRWLCVWAFILSCFFFMSALPKPSGEAFLSYGFIEMLSYLLYNISELIISILGFSLYAYLMILPFALWGKINEHF